MPTEPLDELRSDVSEIKRMLGQALNGDPGQGQPGIWIRLDRVEQVVRAAIFIATTAFLAATAAIGSAFTGHK